MEVEAPASGTKRAPRLKTDGVRRVGLGGWLVTGVAGVRGELWPGRGGGGGGGGGGGVDMATGGSWGGERAAEEARDGRNIQRLIPCGRVKE